MKLENKVAIITGGARGIGRAIAEMLAGEGANPVVVDVDINEAENTAKELRSGTGRDSMAMQIDVSSAADAERMAKEVTDKYGRIDILVNNAGITRDALLVRMKEDAWDKVLAINLKGVFNCTQAAAKVMMKQHSGKIVNMASIIGIIGNVGQANYAASKGGVIALTKTSAKELSAWNINVNAIAPGFIDTKMTQALDEKQRQELLGLIPLKRLGMPQDVARLVLFLASGDSDYITGQVIRIDGGMAM
ncbi:3-oxoacyl-ACP reductase [Candidatus Desantisbacteria bacterium CG_4_10_14_0_8_um_filter_48_22]|uniref:3-oxoacyl-[acyl-carrier-protein] reductase n=1 Tax=Candidatus Desantisbacteria bacterium CG_4_10_14_0_8_um_filter_48_22 TaxID=1974543 RepID=A0A2M7SEU7_9BACT|nr:MAG: 3-oxoacyl-ACP reductase [Candidatus Desantisbacteria bacterium CG02_land_8_20_14_3_00_49_13]PIZ18052.1 MAG: 3-oxoacyl-ACP reductase [Candidatus Desantisbacteria bacterium CG_4_10_14_0_8_um_filter_48_22]